MKLKPTRNRDGLTAPPRQSPRSSVLTRSSPHLRPTTTCRFAGSWVLNFRVDTLSFPVEGFQGGAVSMLCMQLG